MFWCCDGGEAVLHRHLRTLNMARVPRWAAEGGMAAPADGSGLEPSPVMFRHWDPRVLGALLPVLDGAQFARVLGPAGEFAFLAVDYGGVRRVVADPAFPPAPSGMLTIRSDQVEALSQRRLAASHRRIAAYLRDAAGDQTTDMDDVTLLATVRHYDGQAKSVGLKDEYDIMLWSFMQVTSTIDLHKNPDFIRYMADPRAGRKPSDRIRNLFDLRTNVLSSEE